MSKKLLAVDLVLLLACALFVALMVRTSRTSWPALQPARPRPPVAAAPPAAGAPESAPGAQGYGMIATRNLFSPTRSEAPPAPEKPAVALPKPNLFGVVVREGASIAYLEDPVTKRVAGYRQGDSIAGGTVHTISDDRVVLARPEGNVDVRLHDPSKPRPPAPAATPPAGAAQRQTPGAAPGATPAAPGAPPGVEPPVPGRRPLPPNLLRRLPPSAPGAIPPPGMSNAPQQ